LFPHNMIQLFRNWPHSVSRFCLRIKFLIEDEIKDGKYDG